MPNLWNITNFNPRYDVVVPGDTITDMFWNALALRAERQLMRQKDFGIWQGWTWREVGNIVRELAMGFVSLGVKPGECVSILSNTKVEWVWCDLAILNIGGVSNGIYPTDAAEQVQYLCKDSRSVVLVVEDEEQLDKALAVRAQLPLLRKIVLLDDTGLTHFEDPMVVKLDELRRRGAAYDAASPQEFDALRKSRRPEDLAILIYTSGTTGKPKGAMHTHKTVIAGIKDYAVTLPQTDSDDRMCFLPLCHVAERVNGLYFSLYSGTRLNFVENPDTVNENVREIAPTMLFGVPRMWEKFYSGVTIASKESGRLQQLNYAWALSVGYEVVDLVLQGRRVGPWLRLKYRIASLLALDNIRRFIGIQRCRMLVTGAAPIAPDLIRWYLALGVPMIEAYGLTETGNMTAMPPDAIRLGTIGKSAPFVEVRVDAQTGELLARGPGMFLGYLNQPEKTAETIDKEGWVHTGDLGEVDADGYFKITDRIKDVIITAGGKNITPSEWENELKFSPYVTDAIVIGDQRPYLAAIVMIDLENVERYAQDAQVQFSNYASLTRAPEVQALIGAEIEAVNKKFARAEQIKKFYLLDTQLSAEDEELTPTMKLKRKLVQQKYAEQIEAMYR